jgi:hypothetical protein
MIMKDSKGHGSNTRGGSYPNIDVNLRGPGQHVGYGNGPWRITKLGSGYLGTHAKSGDTIRGTSLGHISSQLQEISDRAYPGAGRSPFGADGQNKLMADRLASGPKSAPAPVHESMANRYQAEHGWDGDVGKVGAPGHPGRGYTPGAFKSSKPEGDFSSRLVGGLSQRKKS